jgi:hypothetical protein
MATNEVLEYGGVEAPERRFRLLPTLAMELRLEIWSYALPGLTVISIEETGRFDSKKDAQPSPTRRYLPKYTVKASEPISALLHVNSEARTVALQHYRLGSPAFLADHFPSMQPKTLSTSRTVVSCGIMWYNRFSNEIEYDELVHVQSLIIS